MTVSDSRSGFALALKELKATLALSIPIVLNLLFQFSITVIDGVMAGMDGSLTLAAVSQGSGVFALVLMGLLGLLMPMAPQIAQRSIQSEWGGLLHAFHQGVLYAALLIVPSTLILALSPVVFRWLDVPLEMAQTAQSYVWVMCFALPFVCLSLPVRYWFEGSAKPVVLMWITLASLPINILGNYIFLNGLLGLPKMGAPGMAIASVLSMVFVFCVSWLYWLRKNQSKLDALLSPYWRFDWPYLKKLFGLGVPNAVALLLEGGIFIALILLSGRLGVSVAAANQIAYSYITVTYTLVLGVSTALMTRIGMAHAAQDLRQVRFIGFTGIGLGLGLMFLSVCVNVWFAKYIVALFNPEAEVAHLALGFLFYAALLQIPDGVMTCAFGALRGLEDNRPPMIYALIGFWFFGVPLSVFFAFYLGWGGQGLWLGLTAGLIVVALFAIHRFVKQTIRMAAS